MHRQIPSSLSTSDAYKVYKTDNLGNPFVYIHYDDGKSYSRRYRNIIKQHL